MKFSNSMNCNHQFCSVRYYDLRKDERFKELQEKKSQSESEVKSCKIRTDEILVELDRFKDIVRNQDQIRRNIEDNLNYRETKAKVDKFASEIESLEERVLKIGGVSTFETELGKHLLERERLLSEVYMAPSDISYVIPFCLTAIVIHTCILYIYIFFFCNIDGIIASYFLQG